MSLSLPSKAAIPIPTKPVQPQNQLKPAAGRKSSVHTHRSSSISSWVKNILPSHRPERRGTLRRRGYWEQQELTHPNQHEPHRAAMDRRSRRSATVGSNHITEWNMARDLPDGGRTSHDREETMGPDADRKWSWTPGDDTVRPRIDVPIKKQEQGSHRLDQNQANVAAVNSSGSQSLSTTELQCITQKQESRRLRRNLKESGDYLGVQGFNPYTGQLDVVTSTESGRSSLSQETQQKLLILRNTLRDARHSYKSAKERSENEVKKILWKNEKEKLRRLEKEKEDVKNINKTVKWKRHARQWSSAQEPDLSPIAQSIIGTAESSRRESQIQNSKLEHRDSMSNLIDLDSSCNHSYRTSALHGDQPLARSPDSTATVVKTLHGQSLADSAELGPSAWELFVNGISFDSSDEPVPTTESNLVCREMMDTKQFENVERPVSGDKPTNCHQIHSFASKEEGKQSRENIDRSSFLDMRRQRQEDPRGEIEINSLAPLTSKHVEPNILSQKQHLPQVDVNLSSQFKEDRGAPTTINYNTRGEEPRSSFMTTTEQVLQRHQSGGYQVPQGKPVIATGPRGKLIQNWGHWISRRRGSRISRPSQGDTAHMQKSQPSQAAHSAVSLTSTPQIPDSWETDLTSRLGQQIFAHRPEMNLRVNTSSTIRRQTGIEVEEQHGLASIAKTNKPTNKDISARENRESIVWKEDRIKQPVPVNYACTHTTTTTGCDQQDLQVNSRTNIQRDTEKPSILRLERQISGKASELLLAARSESNLGAAVMKRSQNQLLSAGQANHGFETDTMLKNGQTAMDESIKRSTRPVAKTGNTATTDVVVSKSKDLVGASKTVTGPKKLVTHGKEKRSKVVSKTLTKYETNDTNIQTESKLVIQEQVRPMAQKDDPDELSDISQGPGSFPGLNVEHTGGDGCQSSSSYNKTNAVISHTGIKEYLETVRCHFLAFFLLYWEIVGPVFNSGSEYWARNRRHESTLADCFALVLALPGAIVAIMGLI